MTPPGFTVISKIRLNRGYPFTSGQAPHISENQRHMTHVNYLEEAVSFAIWRRYVLQQLHTFGGQPFFKKSECHLHESTIADLRRGTSKHIYSPLLAIFQNMTSYCIEKNKNPQKQADRLSRESGFLGEPSKGQNLLQQSTSPFVLRENCNFITGVYIKPY